MLIFFSILHFTSISYANIVNSQRYYYADDKCWYIYKMSDCVVIEVYESGSLGIKHILVVLGDCVCYFHSHFSVYITCRIGVLKYSKETFVFNYYAYSHTVIHKYVEHVCTTSYIKVVERWATALFFFLSSIALKWCDSISKQANQPAGFECLLVCLLVVKSASSEKKRYVI